MVGRPEIKVSKGEEGAEKTDRHTSRKDSKRNNGSTLCLSSRPSLGVICPHVEKMCVLVFTRLCCVDNCVP